MAKARLTRNVEVIADVVGSDFILDLWGVSWA